MPFALFWCSRVISTLALHMQTVAVGWQLYSLTGGAVDSLFTGTSNQLGEFESGLLAAVFGPVPAVLIGGIGTIVVAGLWMHRFPQLRRFRLADGSPVAEGSP
jgi:hypothetical protein